MFLSCLLLPLVTLSLVEGGDDNLDKICQGSFFNFKLGQCDDEKVRKIEYELYTQAGQPGYLLYADRENLRQSPFVPENRVKVLIHGFGHGGPDKLFPTNVKDAYLSQDEGTNVIIVNWKDAAKRTKNVKAYAKSASCTKNVAWKTAYILDFLVQEGATTWDKIHIIGHSLGAQIAGMTGRSLGGNIPRITGLDPARPCFRKNDTGGPERLQMGDAQYIDVMHTDGDTNRNQGQGLAEQLGHIDFYPNGGVGSQPGCREGALGTDDCSHNRAYELFAESIQTNLAFMGRNCEDYENFYGGRCNTRDIAVMGEGTPVGESFEKPFFLFTRKESPYGMFERGAVGRN